MSDIEDEPFSVLLPCTVCSRTFKPEVLKRHVKVCEKTAHKKRRVFDSFKSRVSGTELEEFFGPAPLPGQVPKRPVRSPVKKRQPSKWKETHENLIATLRAARGVEPPPDTMIEAPRPAGNEQCPSCNRFFGPRAFDRHVEFCKEKTARIKLTPSKVSQAQERLEARTKYRAPLSIKPKLTTKEKYSPMPLRKESNETCTVSTSSTKTSPPIPTISRNFKPGKQNSSNFSRQSPIRSSERQRSVSPTKKTVVSSSKPSVKTETQPKSKLKENLKSPEAEDLGPKTGRTGSKTSTQEKIRISNPKQSQLEGENQKQIKKFKKKTREKIPFNPTFPSDNESVGTIDSEVSGYREQQTKHKPNKWSSAESISESKRKTKKKGRAVEETEKIQLDVDNIETLPVTKTRDELKSARKNKHQKPLINDLSVNDANESFGVYVAACTVRRPSSSASKTSLKTVKESPKKVNMKKVDEKKILEKPEKKGRQNSGSKVVQEAECVRKEIEVLEKSPDEPIRTTKYLKTNRFEKMSKIPKPKLDSQLQKVEKSKLMETEPEIVLKEAKPEEVAKEIKDTSLEEKIKKKSKKWRNITEIPTEELMYLTEDFEIPANDSSQELSESAIWEIAAEQFLNSSEPHQSTSAFSVDSLNESGSAIVKKISDECKKSSPKEDDLIVLHVADPSKLIENDAVMKLSVSEPCFPRSNNFQIFRDKAPESKIIDIIVFTASPNAVQPKIIHRKRRQQRKAKKSTLPELSHIREKTFLASYLPKAKRQKMSHRNPWPPRSIDFGECCFGVLPKEEVEDKKKKFIDGLKTRREKIRKWQITSSSHMGFMEEFQKSLENDLKKLKDLSKGKKIRRRPSLKELKMGKIKKMKDERENMKMNEKESEVISKRKKFEYFEINLTDDLEIRKNPCAPEKKKECERTGVSENQEKISVHKSKTNSKEQNQIARKTFECFEISNENKLELTPQQGKDKKIKNLKEKEDSPNSSTEKLERLNPALESGQRISRQNSSLENIEEVDENVEYEKVEVQASEKDIEIEDFILSKPNTQKIFSKEGNYLDELFPKNRKLAEAVTSTKSRTAVQLGFTANSVFDLKLNEDNQLKGLSQALSRGSTRILQKRMKQESHLPQILVKNNEQKENSMISLIEAWNSKKGSSDNEKIYRTKPTLPTRKLPPLTNKNSFQIGADTNDSYDPFKQAERQMLALLSWPSTADIKTINNLSPSHKHKSDPQPSNLTPSPTSAFIKYPNKDDKSDKMSDARRNLNETFEVNKKNNSNEKPTYTSADDWEQIFEKHFDLNRNEMTEKMTRSVKSALDGLLKNTIKNHSNLLENELSPHRSKNELTQNSIITEVLYTSTPKQNKSDRNTKSKISALDVDKTPNTYCKNSELTFDNITPLEDFSDSFGRAKKIDKMKLNSGINLSSLSFCSQISDTTLADEEVMRSNLEIIGKAAAAAAARTPRRKYARSQSVFDERNKMLFAKTYDTNCSSSDENNVEVLPKIADKLRKSSPSRNPNPKPAPSHFYRSQSVVDDRCKGDGDHSEDGDQASSPESNRNRKAKLSGDSAYSSLNRRSPRQSTQRNQQEERLSSSGSENSLPTISDYNLKPKPLDFGNDPSTIKKDQPVKMSKFCHECGSKYPVAVAKFCCECGVRRLII